MRNFGKLELASLALAGALTLAAAPAGAVTPGTNDGSIVANAFNFVPQAVGTYAGPTDDTKTVSSSAPPSFTPGTSTVTGGLKIIDSPTPSIFATGQVDLSGLASGQVSAQDITHYSFQIGGAPGSAQVLINATGNVGFSAGSQWAAGSTFVSFRVQQQFNGPVIIDDELHLVSSSAGTFVDEINDPTHATTNATQSFTVAQSFTFLTNTIYDVTLDASLGGTVNNSTGSLSQTLFANIDPMFTVSGPFTFDVSPGFGGFAVVGAPGPGPGVPEPAAWTMMLLGFGGAGAVLRSRRRPLAA